MALKEEFKEQLHELIPEESEQLIEAIESSEASVSVRINPSKHASGVNDVLRPVPWCHEGVTLASRPQFTFDTDFQSGRYYVQDASSMFISYVLCKLVQAPVRYLDLCAAPGGKTTAAISALPEGSLVVANEIVPLRAKILRENVIKWGSPNCVVTHNRPADFLPLQNFFDVIATDVPCSGEGMMRKDDTAVEQWSKKLVEECAERDYQIIDDIWQCLRPGGLLIYSTCTYNREEDEKIVDWIIEKYGAESIDVAPNGEWRIMGAIGSNSSCYRFMQHRIDGEGLFMSVLRKPDADIKETTKQRPKKTKGTKPLTVPQLVKQWVCDADAYDFSVDGDDIVAVQQRLSADVSAIRACMKVLHYGVTLGTAKGKNIVPSHALALSTVLADDAFPSVEVDYATAMAYMRGESVQIDAPRGYVLLRHAGAVLGFVNNLGNRANNLYPKEWRVRSTYVPKTKPDVVR